MRIVNLDYVDLIDLGSAQEISRAHFKICQGEVIMESTSVPSTFPLCVWFPSSAF